MNTLKRMMVVLFLLLGGVGLVLCLAGIVGVWPARTAVETRLSRLFGRVEGLLAAGSEDLHIVRGAIARSRESLIEYKNTPAPMPQDAAKRRLLLKTLSKTLSRELTPKAVDLRATMTRVAEASVVLQAILADVGKLPLGAANRAEDDRLEGVGELLREVTKTAQELSLLFPEQAGMKTHDSDADVEARLPDAENTLDQIDRLAGACETRLAGLSSRVEKLKATANVWTRWGPLVVTVLLVSVALGQVSLFLLGRRLLRSRATAGSTS